MTNLEEMMAKPKDGIIDDIFDFIVIECPPLSVGRFKCHNGLSKTECRECWRTWFNSEVQP